jgi:hypothetical protein
MRNYRQINYFYVNYLRGFMDYDHSHSRIVLNSVKHEFPKNDVIRIKVNNILSNNNQSCCEIKEISDIISETIPIRYKTYIGLEEKITKLKMREFMFRRGIHRK